MKLELREFDAQFPHCEQRWLERRVKDEKVVGKHGRAGGNLVALDRAAP